MDETVNTTTTDVINDEAKGINSPSETITTPSEVINRQSADTNTPSDSIHSPTDNPTPTTQDAAGLFPAAHRELQEALARIHSEMCEDNERIIRQLTELREKRRESLEAGVAKHQGDVEKLMASLWGH